MVGFGQPSISPLYRSLFLRLELVNGTSLSLRVPVMSDTALNKPIQIDLGMGKDS